MLLDVYWCMPPRRELSHEENNPHPGDLLMDAVRDTRSFSDVLSNWLVRHHEWRDARGRFFNSFAGQKSYTIDRLIGAANMFDILPQAAVPSDVEVSTELATAAALVKSAFKRLEATPERNSVLSAIGRIGKANLKQKIQHRAQVLLNAVPERFPDLIFVLDEAVNCRNYYVHGNSPRFDYDQNFNAVVFFIDALEFVFAASDLIEAGWDVRVWADQYSSVRHPFDCVRIDYRQRLENLKALLPKRA
jgi:hypothetical protein